MGVIYKIYKITIKTKVNNLHERMFPWRPYCWGGGGPSSIQRSKVALTKRCIKMLSRCFLNPLNTGGGQFWPLHTSYKTQIFGNWLSSFLILEGTVIFLVTITFLTINLGSLLTFPPSIYTYLWDFTLALRGLRNPSLSREKWCQHRGQQLSCKAFF